MRGFGCGALCRESLGWNGGRVLLMLDRLRDLGLGHLQDLVRLMREVVVVVVVRTW